MADTLNNIGTQTAVLVGNPNVGKSVMFKNLTNHYVTVSNYPGTTVEIIQAQATFGDRKFMVIDTPGSDAKDILSEMEGKPGKK